MCGIAGLLRLRHRRDGDRETVLRMMGTMERRGPDAAGVAEEGLLTIGHRRLAILDLSERAAQPMRSACGRYLVSYNGEIYNFGELRSEMGLRPEDLRSTSDTEILLHAWARWGSGALDRMAGQWAFAMFDTEEQVLWLVRDRFGEKPLFYHSSPDGVAFASTIGALLEVPEIPRHLDPEALREYLTLRYVLAPRTVIAGVRKVTAGHLLRIRNGDVEERPWYEARFPRARARSSAGASSPGDPDDLPCPHGRAALAEEFGTLLSQASKRCLVSDVPTALLLSDGIDSQGIRASLAEAGAEVQSFTFHPAGDREAAVQESAGSIDLRFGVDERLAAMVPAFSSLTEPTGDGAALATWMLIRAARPNATVFLCGHGADEVLGGYRLSQFRFRLQALRNSAWLPDSVIGGVIRRYTSGTESVHDMRHRMRDSSVPGVPAAARYLINRPLTSGDLDLLWAGSRACPVARAGCDPAYLESLDALYKEEGTAGCDLDHIQNVMLRTFLSENILSFADSVAMDSSAELRMPFLDRDLVSFVFRLPASARVSRWPGRANTKLVLRWWGETHLDPAVVHRRKMTFQFGSLSGLLRERGPRVREVVLGAEALPRVIPGLQEWMSHEPEFYRGPRQGTLWALLALGAWCSRNRVN